MTTSGRDERIRAAIRATADRLGASAPQGTNVREARPGDLFVLGGEGDIAVEWLLVRLHPDLPDIVLIAPADDFPLAGSPDIVLDSELAGRALTVRCGEADWVPARCCSPRLCVGSIPEAAVRLVRGRLADLARGRPLHSPDPSIDFDPEYEEWIEGIGNFRRAIVERSERDTGNMGIVIPLSQFRRDPPWTRVQEGGYALAAESSETLLTRLGGELAKTEDVIYYEVFEVPGGKLVLAAHSGGVQPVWEGPREAAPQLIGHTANGEESAVEWVSGPQGLIHRAAHLLAWVDGRVVIRIGGESGRTVVCEL